MSPRPARASDLRAITVVHREAFPRQTLSQFSERVIVDFYTALLRHAVFVVDEQATGMKGFAVGGSLPDCLQSQREFLRDAGIRAAIETLFHPSLAVTAMSRAWGILSARRVANAVIPDYRLLVLAVADRARGTGVASALVRCFEERIPAEYPAYGLSVRRENVRAIRFYEKMGFLRDANFPSPSSFSFVKRLRHTQTVPCPTVHKAA